MKIAVMGTGGMGGYYGGLLGSVGADVSFIARGEHLKAIKQDGLLLKGDGDEICLKSIMATDQPSEIGVVDVILFCVKLYDIETAAEVIKPLLGDNTMVISVLNGVDGPQRLERIIGLGRVIGGAAYASAYIEAPGTIKYKSTGGRLKIGELSGDISERIDTFRAICEPASFECEVTENIVGALWDKYILLATNAGLSCLCRSPVGKIYNDADLLEVAIALMEEVRALALKQNIAIDPNVIKHSLEWSKGLPSDLFASMYHDMAAGKRMELEGMSGYVKRLGKELGVSTPCHSLLYGGLKFFKDGRS